MSPHLDAAEIAQLLSRSLGLPCETIEGQGIDFRPRSRSVLVVFANGLGGAECLWVLEHGLAVGLAGASRHASPESLREAAQADALPDNLVADLDSFFRTAIGVLGVTGLGYSRLILDATQQSLPDIEGLLAAAPCRTDLQVTLQGYVTGRLTALGAA